MEDQELLMGQRKLLTIITTEDPLQDMIVVMEIVPATTTTLFCPMAASMEVVHPDMAISTTVIITITTSTVTSCPRR